MNRYRFNRQRLSLRAHAGPRFRRSSSARKRIAGGVATESGVSLEVRLPQQFGYQQGGEFADERPLFGAFGSSACERVMIASSSR